MSGGASGNPWVSNFRNHFGNTDDDNDINSFKDDDEVAMVIDVIGETNEWNNKTW